VKRYHFENIYYYESTDYHDLFDNPVDLERHLSAMIACFLRRRLFREILHLYAGVTGLSGYVFLHAHAGWKREWIFVDGKRRHGVQDFIDRFDGECLALFLKCCNPWNLEVHSKQSIVVHADSIINLVDIIRGGVMRMYVPGEGYLDSCYQLRRAINAFEIQ